MTIIFINIGNKERMVAEDYLDAVLASLFQHHLQPFVLFCFTEVIMHDKAGIDAYNTELVLLVYKSVLPVA